MFVVKVFASSAIALGTWSIEWDWAKRRRILLSHPSRPRTKHPIRRGCPTGHAGRRSRTDGDNARRAGTRGAEIPECCRRTGRAGRKQSVGTAQPDVAGHAHHHWFLEGRHCFARSRIPGRVFVGRSGRNLFIAAARHRRSSDRRSICQPGRGVRYSTPFRGSNHRNARNRTTRTRPPRRHDPPIAGELRSPDRQNRIELRKKLPATHNQVAPSIPRCRQTLFMDVRFRMPRSARPMPIAASIEQQVVRFQATASRDRRSIAQVLPRRGNHRVAQR